MNIQRINSKYKELFDSKPLLIRSPGRINLIGEHTDYNNGFVFPAAIDKEIHFAVAKNDIGIFRFYAYDLSESFELEVSELSRTDTSWANYLLGVIAQFNKLGHDISGIDCVFGGDIPMGAGLSSSAAIENGMAYAINELFDIGLDKMQLTKMAQKAEHEYAGVMCGIMDQFASMHGKKFHAMKLDCRSLEYEYAKIDLKGYGIILFDTKVKHELSSSEYNTRRIECEKGVEILRKYDKNIESLRDVPFRLLQKYKAEFEPVVYRRCKYVIEEESRVKLAFESLHNNDIIGLAALMNHTHEGLRDDYEVSCDELDILYDYAKNSNDIIGARMMGGGFGGCTINIVKEDKIERVIEEMTSYYKNITGIDGQVYKVNIVDGTSIIKI